MPAVWCHHCCSDKGWYCYFNQNTAILNASIRYKFLTKFCTKIQKNDIRIHKQSVYKSRSNCRLCRIVIQHPFQVPAEKLDRLEKLLVTRQEAEDAKQRAKEIRHQSHWLSLQESNCQLHTLRVNYAFLKTILCKTTTWDWWICPKKSDLSWIIYPLRYVQLPARIWHIWSTS